MLKIYYAHPMSWYNTDGEKTDLTLLADHGEVINPNAVDFRQWVENAKRRNYPVMQVFGDYIRDRVDVVAFRRFNDGMLGAGVAREILEARIWGKQVWEVRNYGKQAVVLKSASQHHDVGWNVMSDVLSVEETRDRIVRGEL